MSAPHVSFHRAGVATLLLALVLALGGCLVGPFPVAGMAGRPGKIEVQYISVAGEPLKKNASYHIVGKPNQSVESDLYFGEMVRFVGAALTSRSLYEAPRTDRADMVVEVEYGMRPAGGGPGGPRRNTGEMEKYVFLIAREHPSVVAAGATPKTLWSIRLTATNESDDLRLYLALLTAASIDHLGVESFGPRSMFIGENDRAIPFVREGPP